MSRIGKRPIAVPQGATVTVDGQTVSAKGPKGQLTWTVAPEVEVKLENNELTLAPREDTGSWLSQAWKNVKLPRLSLGGGGSTAQ